jgi:histidinol dehydrogenase
LRIIRDLKTAKSTLLSRSPYELYQASPAVQRRIKDIFAEELTPEQAVERIIADVRTRGDAALFDYGRKIDQAELSHLEVDEGQMAKAYSQVDGELLSALRLAADRLVSFHLAHKRRDSLDFAEGALGNLISPIERVGIYVPGGTACYPSTVLMTAIPARVAGVEEIVLTTPARGGGAISPATLVAADIAQVNRVFKVGGAQAIAALAFGTQSVPKVDKVCGPGNIFVVLAKKMVYGAVDIDGLQGPSETVLLADDSADPALCAADLLAQAEHDALACAIMITTSRQLAERVDGEVTRQLGELERQDIAAQSLESRGGIIIVADMAQAIDLVNSYAPEHLCLVVHHAWSYIGRIRNAGAIFVGQSSPEALGDYIAGPSHVIPTGGTARFGSPLGVDDFLKVTSLVALNDESLTALGPAAAAMARAEGLTAHARAIEARLRRADTKGELA